jgi:hypothetical protein
MSTRWEKTAVHDEPELVGAQWWRTAIEEEGDGPSRRQALLSLAGLAAAGLTVGGALGSSGCCLPASEPELELNDRALALQKQYGWDVGSAGAPLALPEGLAGTLTEGPPVDPEVLDSLVERLAPTNPAHAPFYLPVLFQSLTATPTSPEGAPGTRLRDVIRPLDGPVLQEALQKGRGLASLFESAPPGRAVVVDLPGHEAVAFAAGLADRFDPVFILDNWPHPQGVVPSHLTLAATLQMLPELETAAALRSPKAMPVFVLDSNRLAPFDETGERFDNRYLALLPSAEQLKAMGITEVFYVRPTADSQELDDLNADLVEWQGAGIGTQLVHTDAFRAATDGESPPAPDPSVAARTPSPEDPYHSARTHEHHYWYGGPSSHWFFWSVYGLGLPLFLASRPSFHTPSWRPTPRPTIFSTPSGGKHTPSGFGHVSMRQRAGSAPSLAPSRTGSSPSSSRPSSSSPSGGGGTFGRSPGGRTGA